jgi:TrpR-related protein YerC/YecD
MEKAVLNMADDFFEAVLKLQTKEECAKFFDDLCTMQELEAISQRLEVAMLLKEGKQYREITEKTGASTATISRVSKCLRYGGGGYEIVLNRQ